MDVSRLLTSQQHNDDDDDDDDEHHHHQLVSRHQIIRESKEETNLLPLGRILSCLLSVKFRDLEKSITDNDRTRSNTGPVNQSVEAFLDHITLATKRGLSLDKYLIPLIQHATKSRDRTNRKNVVSIIRWLLKKDFISNHVLEFFIGIIKSKDMDQHLKLGWCMVLNDLLQWQFQENGSLSGCKDETLSHLVSCIPDLVHVILKSSSNNTPTRLSVIAANCVILLSKFAGKFTNISVKEENTSLVQDVFNEKDHVYSRSYESESVDTSTSGRSGVHHDKDLLWDHLDLMVQFAFMLEKWNEGSRPLYCKGLNQIVKTLKRLIQLRDAIEIQGGEEGMIILKAVLASCWNTYSSLMLMNGFAMHMDSKTVFPQWIEGLQSSLPTDEKCKGETSRRTDEMHIFFLTCISLLLGRLNAEELESILQDNGTVLLQVLFGQLNGKHSDDAVDLSVGILRSILFCTESVRVGTLKIDTIAPLLMDLLDEKDTTSKAVVALVADYFTMNSSAPEMERLFEMLDSGVSAQRQNALSVISEVLNALSKCEQDVSMTLRHSIATHLLKRLGDAEIVNRIEVSRLFAKLDPQFVLPALVLKVYSTDEKVRSTASSSILSILKGCHSPFVALNVLLDCTSNVVQKTTLPVHPGDIGATNSKASFPMSDMDRIMCLIPYWADEVQEWDEIIDLILTKTFSEPSNPVLPRFLSQLNKHLLSHVTVVFKHVLSFMKIQPKMSEDLMKNANEMEIPERQNMFLFERLSPLLVLKVLPLAAFDDPNCHELYGAQSGHGSDDICDDICIMGLLLERSTGKYEVYDVRKLSAELLGRCIPEIVLPTLARGLQHAVENENCTEVKSYLFSICNLVLLRENVALADPCMPQIQMLLCQILRWPCSSTDDDIFKAQHGCIDCFALMIIAEVASLSYQNQDTTFKLDPKRKLVTEVLEGQLSQFSNNNQPMGQPSILSWIVQQIVDKEEVVLSSNPKLDGRVADTSFRICMVNVLIRATQKIPLKNGNLFLSNVLPAIMNFVQVGHDSRVKTACLQLVFSTLHNLKETVRSYAVSMLQLSLEIMKGDATSEERLAAARVLASLLTSVDAVVSEIAPYLSEVVLVLRVISRMDASYELSAFCEKLLECMTPNLGCRSTSIFE